MDDETDLNELAADLTEDEGLVESMDIGQVKELLGCLGRRWRELSDSAYLDEADAIRERAGTRGGHVQ